MFILKAIFRKKHILFIPTIVLLFFYSCQSKRNSAISRKVIFHSDTLAFSDKRFYAKGDSCEGDNCGHIGLEYPYFLNEPHLNDTLRSEILDFLPNDEKDSSSISIDTLFGYAGVPNNAQPIDTAGSTAGMIPAETMDLFIYRTSETADIITLEIQHDESGGVHPNEEVRYINWDKKHDRNINIEDIINNSDKLNAVAEKIFRHDAGLGKNESLANIYRFDNNEFALNDNFAITDTGLHFFYNPYEIQSYMQGVTIIDIPYKSIKNLIKKNSIISTYIK